MKYKNHLVMCLVLIGIVGLAYSFIPQVQSLGWFGLIILACPVMHLFMGHGGHDSQGKNEPHKH